MLIKNIDNNLVFSCRCAFGDTQSTFDRISVVPSLFTTRLQFVREDKAIDFSPVSRGCDFDDYVLPGITCSIIWTVRYLGSLITIVFEPHNETITFTTTTDRKPQFEILLSQLWNT